MPIVTEALTPRCVDFCSRAETKCLVMSLGPWRLPCKEIQPCLFGWGSEGSLIVRAAVTRLTAGGTVSRSSRPNPRHALASSYWSVLQSFFCRREPGAGMNALA